MQISSELAKTLKIQHPVLLAGMANIATARLAAAVSNAGGLGVIGGVMMTPDMLRREIAEVKSMLVDKTAFGIDLLLPQVGGSARKTNYDYTHGTLPELIDVIAASGCRIFVSAVGVPPRWVVDKLHGAGILVMNMVGHPKHVDKALTQGVDLICAQGHEAGGHSGEVATMVLIPQCVDKVAGRRSPLTGEPVRVVAAGGIYDGRTMAAAFSLGAEAVWVGTRFVASEEATGTKQHKEAVVKAGPSDTVQTLAFTGRPCRMYKTEYVKSWEGPRKAEMAALLQQGIIPHDSEVKKHRREGKTLSMVTTQPLFIGQAAGGINSILPAKTILDTMVRDAAEMMRKNASRLSARL
eukprot:TRINITY_DN5694_c0_g1_i1.p1 TRINITY_DN5694_c0_g1~~TRINITY_DN5694_c0_g1_i1.p1  ORF type:complete len:376 (+),score=143.51 TRINITY_DN5694_c0_g1_i1:73-1128(+)